jgi:30S ribosomal protein S31
MGRGDKKTAKGKRAMGSYGNTRKKKTAAPIAAPKVKKVKAEAPAEKKATTKKAAAPKAAAAKKPATSKKTTSKKSEE